LEDTVKEIDNSLTDFDHDWKNSKENKTKTLRDRGVASVPGTLGGG